MAGALQGLDQHFARTIQEHGAGPWQTKVVSGGFAYNEQTLSEQQLHSHTISAEGSGSAHNNMQPYAAINYIIRAY